MPHTQYRYLFRFMLLCALALGLSGCTRPVVQTAVPTTPANTRAALPAPPPARIPANPAESGKLNNIDFRIFDAHATLGSRQYTLDARDRPVITALGNGIYRLDLTLRRSARSSLRGDETITTHFYYDGVELIFFGDKNRNHQYDRHESGVRYLVTHKREFVTQGNTRYAQPRTLTVTLGNKHISSFQRINRLEMRLVFLGSLSSS